MHGDQAAGLLVALATANELTTEDALHLADMAVHRAKSHFDSHILKLDLLHRAARWDDALAFATEHGASNVRVLLRQYELQLRSQDKGLEDTRERIDALAAEHEVFHPGALLCARALQLIDAGDDHNAALLFESATTFEACPIDAYLEGGRLWHALGALDQMVALTQRGLQRWPQDPALLTHLVFGLRAQHDETGLNQALDQAKSVALEDATLMQNCLAVLDETGRSGEGVALIDAFVARHGGLAAALIPNALMVLAREGHTARVDALLDSARGDLEPAVYAHAAACVWTMRGELDIARGFADQALALGADIASLRDDPDLAPLWA